MSVPPPSQRFRDNGRSLMRHVDVILVKCPKCNATARVTQAEPYPERPNVLHTAFSPRLLTCGGCAFRAQWRVRNLASESMYFGRFAGGQAQDPYFRLPLVLQTATRHGVLFAYNTDHLAWIEGYVGAALRERRFDSGMSNRSIASRLPRWVKAARNREEVVRAIGRMRRRLAELPAGRTAGRS